MERRIIFRLFLALLVLGLIYVGYEMQQVKRQIGETTDMSLAEQVGASNFFWRNCLIGGSDCLSDVTGYADGDGAIVIQDDGGTYKFFMYRYESSSTTTESSPDVITPDDTGTGRWLLAEFFMKTATISQSADNPLQIYMYEDSDNGTNYYLFTVPSAITSNETFTQGRWRIEAVDMLDANRSITVDETKTVFQLDISGFTADRFVSLPEASTCPGCEFVFLINVGLGNATYYALVDPGSGTDQIIGTSASGEWYRAQTAEQWIYIKQVHDDRWIVVEKTSEWTEQ